MYKIQVRGEAKKQILRIPPPHFNRIQQRISSLADNPRPEGAIKLQVETGYRVRVGDYRVLYEIDDAAQTIVIYRVKHRQDVYRP